MFIYFDSSYLLLLSVSFLYPVFIFSTENCDCDFFCQYDFILLLPHETVFFLFVDPWGKSVFTSITQGVAQCCYVSPIQGLNPNATFFYSLFPANCDCQLSSISHLKTATVNSLQLRIASVIFNRLML